MSSLFRWIEKVNDTLPMILANNEGPETRVLTLNRPEKRNALSINLLETLLETIAAAEAEPKLRILVLRASGPVFCSGLDLAEAVDTTCSHRSAELIAQSLLALSGSRLVTIACVHGAAIAGGAGLMSACDFAVASAETKISYPEPRRGLVAGLVMAFLRRQLKERDAREILLTGETFSADRALQIGLLNRVAPTQEGAFVIAMEFAALVRQGGPRAVEATKRMLGELWHRPVKADLDRALSVHLDARNSPEAEEGIAAYREKRPPTWAK